MYGYPVAATGFLGDASSCFANVLSRVFGSGSPIFTDFPNASDSAAATGRARSLGPLDTIPP